MERKFNFSIGEFYHIYNRGNNKSKIFLDNKDKERFIKLLYVCNSTKPVVFKIIQGMPLDKIVLRTVYSIDEGKSFSIYTKSFMIDPKRVESVIYYSIDNAGNDEEAKEYLVEKGKAISCAQKRCFSQNNLFNKFKIKK